MTGSDYDPYERAAEELDRQRRARQYGISLPRGSGAPWRPSWRSMLVFLAVILVIGLARLHGPSLPRSCGRSAVTLGVDRAVQGTLVRWQATGPATDRVLLVIGTGTVAGDSVVAAPGTHAQTGGPARPLTGCRLAETFVVTVPPGSYPVRLYQLTSNGGRPLARTSLTVTS